MIPDVLRSSAPIVNTGLGASRELSREIREPKTRIFSTDASSLASCADAPKASVAPIDAPTSAIFTPRDILLDFIMCFLPLIIFNNHFNFFDKQYLFLIHFQLLMLSLSHFIADYFR